MKNYQKLLRLCFLSSLKRKVLLCLMLEISIHCYQFINLSWKEVIIIIIVIIKEVIYYHQIVKNWVESQINE